jgi:hypothetical protein
MGIETEGVRSFLSGTIEDIHLSGKGRRISVCGGDVHPYACKTKKKIVFFND